MVANTQQEVEALQKAIAINASRIKMLAAMLGFSRFTSITIILHDPTNTKNGVVVVTDEENPDTVLYEALSLPKED